jgi:hypothetical protein
MSQSDATPAKREAIQKVATEVECNLASAADKAQQVYWTLVKSWRRSLPRAAKPGFESFFINWDNCLIDRGDTDEPRIL